MTSTQDGAPTRGWKLGAVSVGVVALVVLGRTLGVLGAGLLREGGPPPVDEDGLALACGILAGATLGALGLAALVGRRGARATLGLDVPTARTLGEALLAGAALAAVFDAARWVTTGSVVPVAWPLLASSAPWPLLALALGVAAPCFEEAFFRGFLQTNLRATRLGVRGTIALTSALFALAHGGGDALSLAEPLAGAVLLGVLRERSGSIVPGVAAHALGNLQALSLALLAT